MSSKEELKAKHPGEVEILLEIYKRSITHYEGYEKLTWATSFQISEAIEAMGIFADQQTESLREELQTKDTLIAGFKEMVGKLEREHTILKDDNQILKDIISRVRLNLKLQDGWSIIDHSEAIGNRLQSLSARVRDLEAELVEWKDLAMTPSLVFNKQNKRINELESYLRLAIPNTICPNHMTKNEWIEWCNKVESLLTSPQGE